MHVEPNELTAYDSYCPQTFTDPIAINRINDNYLAPNKLKSQYHSSITMHK